MTQTSKRILSLALVAVFILSSVPAMSLVGFADWLTGLSIMVHAEDLSDYSEETITLTFALNGGLLSPGNGFSSADNQTKIVTYAGVYGAVDESGKTWPNIPTKTGYKFVGWKNGNTTFTSDATVQITSNTTITAQWDGIDYTVQFIGNGSTSGSMPSQIFTYGTAQNLMANAFNRSYTVVFNQNYADSTPMTMTATAMFAGWSTTASGSVIYTNKQTVTNLTTTLGATVNLYAQWRSGSVTLPTPTRDGYEFGGWYKEPGCTTLVGTGGGSYSTIAAVTLYAKWVKNECSLTIDPNGGLWNGTSSATVVTQNPGSTYTVSGMPTRTGYSLNGWTMTGAGAWNSATNVWTFGDGDGTLTANWQAKTYTVTLNGNGATSTNHTASLEVTYDGQMPNASAPTRNGYTFMGYYDMVSGGTKYYNAEMNGIRNWDKSRNATLYARWNMTEAPVHAAGDIIEFGSYPQSVVSDADLLAELAQAETDENGDVVVDGAKYRLYSSTWYAYEPVKWKVLSEEEGEYFLFAVDLLDCLPYHNVSTNMTWENCSLRSWLNADFYNECFTEQEKQYVLPTAILNGALERSGSTTMNGGNNTEDNVYLLSYNEAKNTDYGFSATVWSSDSMRKATPSEYAIAKGVATSDSSGQTVGAWWLRTTGRSQNAAAYCRATGALRAVLSSYSYSQTVTNATTGVRPAIHITYTPVDPADETIKSGKCGDTARWVLDTETGLLTIRGVGDMYNYEYGNTPWEEYKEKIQAVVIRSGVTSIGSYAANGWGNVTELTIPDTVTQIAYDSFNTGMPSLQTLNYNAANCVAATTTDGDTVSLFGQSGAYNALLTIHIGETVKTIPAYAFADIGVNLNTINIGKGVTKIGAYAFKNMQRITSIVLPSTVTTIDEGAFYQCDHLANVSLSSALTTIGKYAFFGCDVQSVSIPSTVTSIGDQAFSGCSTLGTIQYNATNSIVSNTAFENCNAITKLTIGASVTSIPSELFVPCTVNTEITLNASNSSFYMDESGVLYTSNGKTLIKCTDWTVTEYVVPDMVTAINSYAFYGVGSLTSLTVMPYVTSIGTDALPKQNNLTVYGHPNTTVYTYCANNQINFESLAEDTVLPSLQRLYVSPSTPSATSFSISITAKDDLGLGKVIADYSLDDGETYTILTERNYSSWELSTSFSSTLDVSNLPSGKVIIRAAVLDRYNNRSEATVTRTIDHTPPAPPESVTITETPSYIQVMWTKDSVEDDFNVFRVYRSTSPDSGFSRVKQLSTIGYYDDLESGALAGTTYYYYITCVDVRGNESEPSAIKSGKLMEDDILPKVVSYTPAAGTNAYNKSMTITVSAWDNYKLGKISLDYRLKDTENWTHLTDITVSTKNAVQSYNWNMTALAAGEYEVRMTATDSVGNLSEETIATYTIVEYQTPVAPTLTTENGHRYVQLRWSYTGLQNLVSSYAVYRKPAGSDSYTHVVTTGKSAYADAVAVGDYVYKVVVNDIYGASASSVEVAGSSIILDEVAPTAYIYMKNPIIIPGRSLVFNGSYSYDNDQIASYLWEFGDGETAAQATATHSYDEPGTYTATLTVTDAAGNTGNATITLDVVDVSEESGKQLVNVTVRDSAGDAINGASVVISEENDSETRVIEQTDANGVAEFVLDGDKVYDMYTYKEDSDYSPDQTKLDLTKDEAEATQQSAPEDVSAAAPKAKAKRGIFTPKIRNTSVELRRLAYFTGTLTAREMTPDEIEEANIDTSNSANMHSYKFTAKFTYEYEEPETNDEQGENAREVTLTYYTDSAGRILGYVGGVGSWWQTGSTGWGGSGSVPGYAYNGWLQIDKDTYIKPLGGHNNNKDDKDDTKQYFLKLQGKVGWLKQMFRVDLIVLNSSKEDWMENCTAKLNLPDGLSLAALENESQNLKKKIGKIDKNGQGSATWYVRGDKIGIYDLSVRVEGKVCPEPYLDYDKVFVTEEPIIIQDMSNAISLSVEAPQSVENGMSYGIRFTLTNMTDKDLYFVTLKVEDEEFDPVTLEAFDSVSFTHSTEFDFSSADEGTITAYLAEQTLVCGEYLMKERKQQKNGLEIESAVYFDAQGTEKVSKLAHVAGSFIRDIEDAAEEKDCDQLYLLGTIKSKKDYPIREVTVTVTAPDGFSFRPMEIKTETELSFEEVQPAGEPFSVTIYPIYSDKYEKKKDIVMTARALTGESAKETYSISMSNFGLGLINFRPSGKSVSNYSDFESVQTVVSWDITCFGKSAMDNTVDEKMAKLQAVLSAAAYREKDVKYSLRHLGFSKIESYNYYPGEKAAFQKVVDGGDDYVGHTFAKKKIVIHENGKDKVYVLFAVVVRGTVYTEWYGNVNMGEGDVHKGFSIAKENITKNLQIYMQKNGEDVERSKMLITGHSRGAAAANLLAGDLCTLQTYASRENTYVYLFATPRGTKHSVGYACIKNILFDEDVVTAVAMESWGYRRNGLDLYFKPEKYYSSSCLRYGGYTQSHAKPKWGTWDTALADIVDGAAQAFSNGCENGTEANYGVETVCIRDRNNAIRDASYYLLQKSRLRSELDKVLNSFLGILPTELLVQVSGQKKPIWQIKNYSEFVTAWESTNCFSSICKIKLPLVRNNRVVKYEELGNMTAYELACSFMRMAIVVEENEKETERIREEIRTSCNEHNNRFANAVIDFLVKFFVVQNIWGSHCMENYMSYIDVSGTDYRTYRRHEDGQNDVIKEVRISCPVDVEVYDAQNNLVGKIVQNVVDDSIDSMVDLSVEGDTKVVRMFADENHYIKIIGNDDGTMNYTVSEYDETGAKTRQVNFFDIPVENGKTISGMVNDELDTPIENYYLTMPSGSTVTESENLTDDAIDSITISTGSIGHGFAFGDGVFTSGDNVTLYAFPNEGEEFLGWYADDSLVSAEATYSFIARASGEYTAKFTTLVEKVPDDRMSVSIDDQISLNLLLDLDARDNVQCVTITYKGPDGKDVTKRFTDFNNVEKRDGRYRFVVEAAPAQIADTITIDIDGTVFTTSIKEYCTKLLEGDYEKTEQALAQAILEYGQAANNYFAYTDAQIADISELTADAVKTWQTQFADTTGKVSSASFMALTKPEFRFYTNSITEEQALTYNEGIHAAYTDTSIKETLTARFVKNTEDKVLIEVTGVSAENMDETITVTIDGLGTITFAGNDFAKVMANNPGTEMLGAALYNYGIAAKACFR